MGVIKTLQDLAEIEADNVMEVIGACSVMTDEMSVSLLDHLYELHKLRDVVVYNDVWAGLIIHRTNTGTTTHPSFPTFLQM